MSGSEKIWSLWTGWTGKLKANTGFSCSWSSLGSLQVRRLRSYPSILLVVLHGFTISLADSASFTGQIWVFGGGVSTVRTQNRFAQPGLSFLRRHALTWELHSFVGWMFSQKLDWGVFVLLMIYLLRHRSFQIMSRCIHLDAPLATASGSSARPTHQLCLPQLSACSQKTG